MKNHSIISEKWFLLARASKGMPARGMGLIILGMLLICCRACPAAAEAPVQIRYFYISSVPGSPLETCYTQVMEARCRAFDPKRIREQYTEAIRRQFPTDPYRFLHHAQVYGPFPTRKAAEADRARNMSSSETGITSYTLEIKTNIPGRPSQRFPFRFTFSEVVVVELRPPAMPDETGVDPGVPSSPAGEMVGMSLEGIPLARFTRGLSQRSVSLQEIKPNLVLMDATLIGKEADRPALIARIGKLITEMPGKAPIVIVDVSGQSRTAWNNVIATIKSKGQVNANRISYFSPTLSTGANANVLKSKANQLRNRILPLLDLPVLSIRLNELMAKNLATLADEKGEFEDWVEIINTGVQPFDVGGMYLSEDPKKPTRWRIPQDIPSITTIAPGGVLLIWCDNQAAQGPLHANFKLSASGEELVLTDIDSGATIDSVRFPALPSDRSYGRVKSGGDWKIQERPTPGRP